MNYRTDRLDLLLFPGRPGGLLHLVGTSSLPAASWHPGAASWHPGAASWHPGAASWHPGAESLEASGASDQAEDPKHAEDGHRNYQVELLCWHLLMGKFSQFLFGLFWFGYAWWYCQPDMSVQEDRCISTDLTLIPLPLYWGLFSRKGKVINR